MSRQPTAKHWRRKTGMLRWWLPHPCNSLNHFTATMRHNAVNYITLQIAWSFLTKHKTCRFLICALALRQSRSWYSITAQQRCFARPHNQLCSPCFDQLAPRLRMTELCPHPKEQYQAFRRTTLKMRGELEQSQLGAELAAQEQVLCIVNRRKTAQELYNNLPEEAASA